MFFIITNFGSLKYYMARVSFQTANIKFKIPERSKLSGFIEEIFLQEDIKLNKVVYVFCSDDFLLSLNKEFLGHNYYTDIITFDLSEAKTAITAEIYISIDRIKINATAYDVSDTKELLRVVFHGVLHLCGYKDKTKIEIAKMREAEDKYLFLYKSK